MLIDIPQSFLSTSRKVARDLDNVDHELLDMWFQPNLKSNQTLIDKMIQYNISWSYEYEELVKKVASLSGRGGSLQANLSTALNDEQTREIYIWHWRLSLKTMVRIHAVSF